MRNLAVENIGMSSGKVSRKFILAIENAIKVILPIHYVDFIVRYNEATLVARIFSYQDPNIHGINSNALHFSNVKEILQTIKNLKSGEEPDWPIEYRFEDGLIPFGENGGGDYICFDYRHDKTTDNPPIVIWNHDMGLKHRVVFVANNFEEFINMLHEPED